MSKSVKVADALAAYRAEGKRITLSRDGKVFAGHRSPELHAFLVANLPEVVELLREERRQLEAMRAQEQEARDRDRLAQLLFDALERKRLDLQIQPLDEARLQAAEEVGILPGQEPVVRRPEPKPTGAEEYTGQCTRRILLG